MARCEVKFKSRGNSNMAQSAQSERLRLAIEVIADKWRITVLLHLLDGPLRTGKLQKCLRRVSPKMLIQTLRGLERDGLIQRVVMAKVPPHVEYSLTTAAKPLIAALRELSQWSEAYGGQTLLARRHYDSRA